MILGKLAEEGWKFDGVVFNVQNKRRGRDVVESLITAGKTAVCGGVILKFLLESSPASLLEGT